MVRIALFLAIGVAGAAVAGVATFFVEYQSDVKRADASNLNQVAVGRSLYAQHCAACHGVNLEGQPEWRKRKPDGRLPAPPHDSTGHTWEHSDEVLFRVTKEGFQTFAGPNYQTNMPAFGTVLTDKEIWAVLVTCPISPRH